MNTISIIASTAFAASGALYAPDVDVNMCNKFSLSSYSEYGVGTEVSFYKDNAVINFCRMNTTDLQMTEEMVNQNIRYKLIDSSFKSNLHGFPMKKMCVFTEIANVLCKVPFNASLASYNEYDDSIDIKLYLPFDIHLSISHFLGDSDELVVFSIHRESRLLVSNEMLLDELELKTVDLLKELNEKYA